uniref:Tudor domain-containing protein n=1 Tax=Panagrolaimus davidi TaxID=227884 RepID=A0A914PHI9_9BILA
MPKLPIPFIVNGNKLTKAVVYESRTENCSYFVKVSSTKAQEMKLMEMLRNVKTIDLVNPYPHAFCICYHNNVPYRAQIIAQITSTKINVELFDVGEFLTQLKISESDESAKICYSM